MPYNPIYDGQFDYPEKIYNLSYSPYINSDIDMPTPLFSPDKKLTSGVGFGESSYDTEESAMSVTNPSFINRQRASNQSEWVKGFNSIVGGVASGLATAVQDVSYLLDIDNGIKRLTGAEEVEENAIGQLMRDFKQGLATTMPIYKEDPNKVWSWSDSGSYWEALKGVIDSAVGFGLPGLGAAKLVGSAVKAARVNALLQAYLTENKVNAITSLGAGFMTNYAEGKTMAIEAYENSMQNLKSNYYDGILKKYIDQGLDPNQALELANKEYEEGLKSGKEKEFSKIAGSEADKFQRNNMVFMLTDALGIHGVLKGTKGFTRSMIDKNELKNYFLGLNADNFLVQGVKEGAEEIGQNIMQSEAEYRAAERGGIETGEPSDFTQRMIKFGTDDKALLEGAMGFFGGPAQRVLMSTLSGKYSSSYKKSIQDQIDKQDTQLKENEATLNSILNTQAKANDLKAEALMNGDTKATELIDKTSFALLAANNFVNGTTERLERSLYDILDMDEEQANKEGYTPDYKEKAQSMLEDLKVLEKEWIGISGYSTASPLFMKMQDAKYLRSIRENLMQEKDKESTNLKNYLLKNHGEEANKGKIPVATFKPTGTLTFDEINEIATTGNTSSEREDMLDFEYIKSLPEYQNFSKALNRLNTADEALGKTIDDIKYYKSNEGIREYKESIKNAKKLIEEVEKAKKVSKKKESERSKRKEDASKTKKESEGKPNESANPVITPETTDVVPGDFDDLMDNPPITEGINPTEDLIGNSVSPELNKELQKEATASNEELEKSFKDNQELKKELQEGVVTEKIGSEELNDGDIESKKADIERRRQEELNSLGLKNFAFQASNIDISLIEYLNNRLENEKQNVDYLKAREPKTTKSIPTESQDYISDDLKHALRRLKEFEVHIENANKVNAKYDAELALLEQSHTTPSEVASKLEEDEAKINDTGYNSNTYQEVIDESNSVESTIEDSSRAIVKPDGSIVYDYGRINQGNNVVAFLSRAYEDIVTFVKNIVSISRQDLDNKLNESSKNALRYKNNKPGTKLKFVVEDNPDAVVYIKDSQETTTWGAVSAGLDKSSDEFIMQVPIAIYNEVGDKIGYVHTKDWITEKHVSGDLNTDMEALSKTRKAILSGKVNGIITGNNAGMFFRTIGNQLVAVSKAMPDPKLELVVSKNGLPYTNRNTTSNKTPINKLKDGLLYAIVPYGDKHVALPLMVGNINENHARALIKAITIYATNDTKNPFREYVLKTLKLDITTPAGINEFLKIYVNDTSLNGNIVPGNTNAFRFHVSKGKIYFARGGTDITKAPYIAQSGDTNSMAFRELMNLISNNIRTLYYNVSLDKLDSGNIISLDADGNASESNYRDHIKGNSYSNILGFNVGTESDPEYTYTLQPSITFSIDSKEDTTKPSKEENKVVTKPVNVSTTDKEKPVKKALPSKLIKKINTDDDITSDALLSSNTKKALENNSKNVYSPKLGAKIQNGVVNYIIGRVIDKAFSSMDLADRAESKKLDITGELESIKNEYIKERDEALANVEELTKLLGDEEYNQEDIVSAIESNKYYAAMANTVIEEWKVMTRLAQEGIFKLNNAKFDTISEESIDNELEDNGESPERAFDSSQLTFDTLNKLSVKVKRLFGGIKKVKNNGEPLLNAFNQEMSMPFDEVYNTLQSLTTNIKPSYEVMKAKMLASKERFPWITQVIDKLDAADELTRNSFVTGMSNHSRDMKFYMWARDKNGKFTLSEYDANANSVTQILLNTWANNIMYNINSEISKQMVIGDSVVIAGNPEVIDLVQAQFEKFRTNPSKVTTEELSQWLKSIGIELSTKSIEYIRNNMVASKNWNANFSSRSGIFNIINSNLGKLKNDNIDGSDFLKDSALKELARIEATFSNDVLPTSFRAGKKSVFSYGNNNLLVDSIRRLKEYNTLEDGTFTSDVLTELMSTSFTRESYWLKSMLVYDAEGKPLKGTDGKYRIDPNSSGYANLNHAVMSLEAIKEIKTKSRDNRELHKLSPAEVELVKIAMLQSVTSDLSGKNQRRIKVTFPTTSDKTTVMMLSTIAFDIKYNTDGTIDDNTLNRLYDIFVLPELYRITNYQANGKKLNVDAYNDGADKFLLFPEFNNIDGLFDEDGNISLEAYNDSFKSKFKDLINKYIEELVSDKLSNWNTYGIGLSSKPGDEKPYTNAFLDAKFMDNITTKGVAKENAVKAAATDMVVQYLVSNVEAMKMFIGDPAQFWKAKPTDDIITATRKLYDNVGKRLAGDIAPGTTLAESEGNTYIQLFAEDVETPSKELDDRLFMYLSPEDLKAYKKMNSADAQEYTTWKEHLDVLFMLGKITQQDKDTITSIINRYVDKKSKNLPIEKEDRLTKDQIHMVLQPMKPVYVNTSVYEGDYDFRRRVYIKSSSFPLIPELTDGLEIDNLRVAMEELETSTNKGVRLAYASAAKIGAVSSKATIFKNGRFVKGLKFTEDNYLVLDRKGFRIQQEIPYDPNKQEIREVTQASKNLFLDVLDVNEFKLPNDNTEYSGKQLYNKFVEAHSKLYTTSKMLLLNRILNKDSKTINIPELRELLKEEALKRNYNISDRLLIDLDKDLEFLPYSAIESKYQAVLNAIVYNNIVKQKIHGKSFVLGSQVGFKNTEVISSAKGISGIIFTEEFDSEIKPMHIVNGELKPNQVILPWKFRDNYGNILDINNFTKVVNDRVVIDTTKLPKELLLGFGMRIPNQAQNSQAVFEIVGFLPESMQDLIIAPEEFTIQMGSDFDVDKLYTYTYNTWYNNKTKELSKISLSDSEIRELYYKRRDKDENVDKLLEALFGENATEAINYDYELFAAAIKMLEYQNELVDIHIASHMNPHPKVQEAISKPLDNWIIEDVAAEVNKARISRESNRMFAPMSESYQTKKFMQATAGKAGCLGYGTKVLMYNGEFKEVQDVKVGDLLMGIDSTPRKVLQLCRGQEQMYWIRQNRGIDYRVNESHILSLKYKIPSLYSMPSVNGKRVIDKSKVLKEGHTETCNITVNNYINSNANFKRLSFGYKASLINFSAKPILINPYYLGLWLGDGSTRDIKTIHNLDKEVIAYLDNSYGIKYQDGHDNISIHISDRSMNTKFKETFNVNKIGLESGRKHIPSNYLYNTKEVRLQLLAGLIDSDGYYCNVNKQYIFSNTNKTIIDQFLFLTRSLGFYTSVTYRQARVSKRGLNEKELWTIRFIPECDIPVKIQRKVQVAKSNFKNRLHTGLRVEKDIVDNYYGFVLDGDHLFMLEDFTVTHNTGIFSLDSMFNALAQTVNTLEFNSTDNKGNEILKPIAFGNVVSDFKLNRINTLDNKYTISKVISGYQSASVDNEKLQVLDKLNINSETFEVIKLLNQLGFGEEVLWFISQDIIFDYVNEVIRLKGTLGEFVKDAKILAFMNTLINKYGYTQEGIQSLVEFGEGSTLYNPSLDDMKSLVKYSKDSVPSNFKEAQAHILLKFMNLQSLAKDLSTLERGINLDSKGFGASLFDSIEKEESIIKSISSNNIKGASSLFGDVVINPKAEAISELESNGYVLLEYNNSNLNIYIKPTTIPGLALVHGLDVNNSLWREISPIASQRFQTISKRMAVLTTADTRSNKAEFNKEVWDGVRSFIFANSNWNDSLNNTSERREILLTDKESEIISNINGVDTKVKIKTSKSLGTILNEIKNTPLFRSNAFLRRLEVIPQTTNGITIYTIQYRAGIKEGVNDTEIYTDFLGLLLNEVKITDNNNKEYTTTDLAQDLIEYSFITGGIQGATEFIKLIPPAYLHSIGMFKYVNDFFYEDSTLLPLTDLYAFNRFELEFIRNNPELVKPKVNTSDEEFKSFKPVYDSSKRLQAFTIPFVDNNGNSNTGLIARYTTLNEGNVVPVPFITIRNYNSPSGYDLYYFDGQSQYLYISTLGNKNISEYNSVGAGLFNSTYKPVIMPDVDKPITNIAAPTINSKSIFDSTTISIAYDNLLKHLDGNELKGKEGVKALLDLLAYSSSTDAVDSSIISIMSNNLHKLPDNIKIVFNLDEASDKEGMFVYDINNNNINTLFFKDTLLGQLATKDGIDYALPIILHELYHAFTSRLITKFSKGEKIEDDNLRKILVSLESSRRQYKEHLSNKYPEEFKEFNIKYSKFTGGDKTITFSDREIAIFYPSVSLKEFTAQTTSAEDFMNELNMIYSDNSTLLSKVFDSLSKLLSYIFGVDNNTLFYKSLTESLELINPELDTTQAIEDNINTSNLQISEKENNKIPKATGLMKFSYGNNKRADVTSLTTLEAIKKGERTATTRYESDGNINYWKNLKVGDIIEWEGQNSEKVLVEVTKPLHKLRGSGKTAEQWSKLEGWSVDYFNSKVKPRLDEAWQIEFKPISDQTINTSNSNYKWARYSNNSYEVSSQGDKRFSALFAKLQPGADITIIRGFPDGTYSLENVKLKAPLTIEEIYQIYIKGYKTVSEGKGKPPKYDISKEESYNLYKNLWRVYLEQNPELEQDLREKAKGKVLTDKFASTDISQARALAEILNEKSTIVNKSTLQKRNVFTINPTKAIDKKASVKASVANKFIGYGEGIEGSSTENYRKQAGEYANTGNYNSNDVVFVSIGGKRPANNLELKKSQQDRTIKEAIKAIEAGATLITDNVNYIHYNSKTKQQRPITMSVEEFRKEDGLYNEGEKRLYENLKVKGYNYSEQTVDGEVLGVWTNNNTSNIIGEEKLSKPSVIESYTEFGTTYKFELVDGEIVKATYTQGYSSNELELSPKNWYKVYNRLKDTPKQEEVKPTSPPKKSNTTFTFSDGITVDTDFELNSEQAIALQKMADFISKHNSTGLKDNAFILSGYAGTGKTSIIKYLVKYIREANRRKGKYQTIVFSSPTHRANMQLKKNTKETVNTMHLLFGLSPDLEIENLDYNDLKFITIADPKFGPEDILIVDESSMISAAMLKIMEDLVESFGSTSTKVIFMGDKAQLGPVKDYKQSPVFDLVNKADLTKVERTKDSPLLDEITHIRNAKQDEKPYTYSSTQNANGNGVTFVTKRNQFLESIAKAFLSTEFKNDKLAYRALAFTNEEVKEINTSVRNAMFGNDAVNQYQKGELVMAYANRFKSMRTKEFMYMNGTDYIVTQSSNGVKEYNGIQYNGVNVTLQSEYDPDITVSTFVIITENNSITNLKALSSYLESLRLAAVRALGSSKGVLWKEYYNNFNSFVVNSNVTEINPVTGKSKVLIPKGIDYGYAHTIHKSQGGEYKQVFINDADISRSPDENMKSQLRYVAASRAKEHATIFYSNTISKEKITNFEEDSTTPDYRDFSMPLSDIPDIPDHILDNPDYDPNKIMNDYNSRIDNIDFDNDINTFNDINPSPEDSYHSDLLLKGYITRDDIERLKKICK